MKSSGFTKYSTLTAAAALVMVAACSESVGTVAGVARIDARPLANQWSPENGYGVEVCKVGPVGTYTFNVSVKNPPVNGDYTMPAGSTITLTVVDPAVIPCQIVFDATSPNTPPNEVTVTEIVPPGMQVSMVQVSHKPAVTPRYSYPGTPSFTVPYYQPDLFGYVMDFPGPGGTDGYIIKFINVGSPPPPEGKGCTPGYWKQEQHFSSWGPTGLTPSQTIGSIFSGAAAYGLGGYSLLDGLSFKGSSTLEGAAQILLRAAIAAQLNARHPDVGAPETAAAMVNAVNAALASGDRDTILGLASDLDDNNNLGCFLD